MLAPRLHSPRVVALCLLLLLAATSLACCQALGPEAFALASRFGVAVPTTARQLAMGATIATLLEPQSANAAFAALRPARAISLRAVQTNFEAGPDLRSLQASYGWPIKPDHSGFQVAWIGMDTANGDMLLPGMGPVTLDMSEQGLVVDYGRRVGAKSAAGLSVLGYHRADFSLTPPLGPALIDLEAKADFGGRAGAVYEYQPGDYLSFLYNFAQHTVDANGLLLGGVASSPVYRERLVSFGISYHPTPRLLAVGEYHYGELRRGPFLHTTSAVHLGGEYEVLPGVALRGGKSDGAVTWGAGLHRGNWSVDYAFLRDWNHGSVQALLGTSDTHALQATVEW